ncbi:MAG TPA: carbohydrate kinase family protein [Burkholderiaceae bacterium]|nr:carbohydrate kinase family protein [Burkholderiaceae bacterium]
MSQRILISGSVAYDTIMVFDGHFKDHILPDRVHMLNVAFLTPRLKREFGGCAANIAFTLRALGGEPVILATVGQDGREYLERLTRLGIDTSQVRMLDELYTAQAFITTDLADNQITAFHPGAMSQAHQVSASAGAAAFGIVAPNGKDAMLRHAREFKENGVPFLFDPGQGLPMFDGNELRALISGASAVAVNDYEASLLSEKTGWSEADIAARVKALIVTRGAQGSQVWAEGDCQTIPVAPIAEAVDPTGCGDAYRGGLLYGLAQGWDWVRSARLGSVMGAIKIEQQGAQNHVITREDVAARHLQAYGTRPW